MITRFHSLNKALYTIIGNESFEFQLHALGGGCINQAFKLQLESGQCFFIKFNKQSYLNMFEVEARGLQILRATDTISVPEPLAVGTEKEQSFLLLQWVEEGQKSLSFWQDFGRDLAMMHKAGGSSSFGWEMDNYIGATEQKNNTHNSWIAFFRDHRLLFQGQLARKKGLMDRTVYSRLEKLCHKLGEFLYEPEKPELIHGDLWSGNYLCGKEGNAWIIDPAVYYGHGECDLAMTEMFGGYANLFYRAYREHKDVPPGYPERRDLYNLYHYLNHLNLFGSGYYGSVASTIQRYC